MSEYDSLNVFSPPLFLLGQAYPISPLSRPYTCVCVSAIFGRLIEQRDVPFNAGILLYAGQFLFTFFLHRETVLPSFYREQSGSPRFHSVSLHTCHALTTPTDPPGSRPSRTLCFGFRSTYNVAICFITITMLYMLQESTPLPVAYMIPCVRFAWVVRR